MIADARREVKPRAATMAPRVIFDATRHRNRPTSFGAGLVETTRWCGDHRYAPFTAEEVAWAEQMFLADRAAEIDAEEQAYNEMLDQLAFEDACIERYTRGYCL